MPSSLSNYISDLKKKHYDDLSDYERGKVDGRILAYSAMATVYVASTIFNRYYSKRIL